MFVNDELIYEEYEEAQDGGFGLSLKKAARVITKPDKLVRKVVKNAPIIKPALKLTKKVTRPVVRTAARPFGRGSGKPGVESEYVEAADSPSLMELREQRNLQIEEVGERLGKGTRGGRAGASRIRGHMGKIKSFKEQKKDIEIANGVATSEPVPVQTESGETYYQEPTGAQVVADSLSAGASTMPGMPNVNMPSLPEIMPQMRMPQMRGMQRFQGQMGRMGMSMPTMPTFTQGPAPVEVPAPVPMVAPQYPQYQEPVASQEPQYYEQAPQEQEYYEQPQPQMVQEAEFEPVAMSDEEMYYDETGEEMPKDEGFWDKVKDALAGGNSMNGLGAVELDSVTGEPVTAVAKSGGFADDYAKGADSLAKLVGQTKAIGSATRKVKRSISRDKGAPAPGSAQTETQQGGIPPALMYGAGAVGIAGLVFLLMKMRSARQAAA